MKAISLLLLASIVATGLAAQDSSWVKYAEAARKPVGLTAYYPLGYYAWNNYITTSPAYLSTLQKAKRSGALPRTYAVEVKFMVDTLGNISGIVPLTSHGYGFEECAVALIRDSGRWSPGMLNGKPVIAYNKQIINFPVRL